MAKPLCPLRYYGGKYKSLKRLLPLLEAYPHNAYVEPFGGSCVVLLNKQPVKAETYNDVDGQLVNVFQVIADPKDFQQFKRRLDALPYSRKLYLDYRDSCFDETDKVIRAVKYFVVLRQSFSGCVGQGWSYVVKENFACSRWVSAVDKLPEVHARLRQVQIEWGPWQQVLNTYDIKGGLFYCDPPYVLSTRNGCEGYQYEMTDGEHLRLLHKLRKAKAGIVLSGYDNPLYAKALKGFYVTRWNQALFANNSKGKRTQRTECIWVSPKVHFHVKHLAKFEKVA